VLQRVVYSVNYLIFVALTNNMTKFNYIFAIILAFIALLSEKNLFESYYNNITYDGRINEAEWENNSEIATDFIMFELTMVSQ
jgi:hypothetical protein